MKINLQTIKFAAHRGFMVLKKYSPEILAVTGVVGVVAGTVECCRSTKKVEPIKEEMAAAIECVNNSLDGSDRKKELASIYIRGGFEIAKTYAPAVSLEACGIACLLGAYGIMRKRNVALMGAYKTLSDMFAAYRERVADEYGEDVDFKLLNGFARDKEEETQEPIVVVDDADNISYSGYGRIFDEFNPNWLREKGQNRFFLAKTQAWCNNLLQARGHLFLNEVYDRLGFDRTPAGAIVGWVLDGPNSDGFVDFGIYNIIDKHGNVDPAKSDFINARNPSVYLDFNVDGVIWDLI